MLMHASRYKSRGIGVRRSPTFPTFTDVTCPSSSHLPHSFTPSLSLSIWAIPTSIQQSTRRTCRSATPFSHARTTRRVPSTTPPRMHERSSSTATGSSASHRRSRAPATKALRRPSLTMGSGARWLYPAHGCSMGTESRGTRTSSFRSRSTRHASRMTTRRATTGLCSTRTRPNGPRMDG